MPDSLGAEDGGIGLWGECCLCWESSLHKKSVLELTNRVAVQIQQLTLKLASGKYLEGSTCFALMFDNFVELLIMKLCVVWSSKPIKCARSLFFDR